MAKKDSRCWPGYELVPGRGQHEQGSCRPKAKSKLAGGEKTFRAKRDKQLDQWKAEHPGSPKKAAQHLPAPGRKTAKAAKKAVKKATKKAAVTGSGTKRTSARKRSVPRT